MKSSLGHHKCVGTGQAKQLPFGQFYFSADGQLLFIYLLTLVSSMLNLTEVQLPSVSSLTTAT